MVTVKLQTSTSFRSLEKYLIILNSYYNLSVKTPSHVTISNWVKKVGYYQVEKPKDKADYWIIIIDESIQIGAEKLLLILGIRASEIDFTRGLTYKDVITVLQISKAGWNGVEISKEVQRAQSMLGKIKYAVSDRGASITKALKLCKIPQIHDITHRVGNILKKVYKNDEEFIKLTKQASVLAKRIQQTKWAFLLPPNQRTQSRFMNLKPVVKWSVKMLKYLEKELPDDFPLEKFNWLKGHENIINELDTVMSSIEEISILFKKKGMNKSTIKASVNILELLKNKRNLKIKEELTGYFQECTDAVLNTENKLCTSDIIESCFGKYKNNISKNSLCGITNLSLFIPASTCETGVKEISLVMESVQTKMIDKWTKRNIGESLLKKRRDALGVNKNRTNIKIQKRA